MVRLYKILTVIIFIGLCVFITGFKSNQITNPPDDVLTLKVLWKFNLAEHNSTQPIPIFDKGTIYIYNNQGKLFALDTKKGAKKWEFKASGKIYSPPSVNNDVLYLVGYDGNLYSLYSSNARIKWTAKTFTELAATPYVIAKDEVIVINKSKIQCYDLETGLDLWKKDCNVMNFKDIYSFPDYLLFTDNSRFMAEKIKNCENVWDYSPANLRVDNYKLTNNKLVLSSAKFIFVVNLKDGKEIWKQNPSPKEILMNGPIFTINKEEIFVVIKNQVLIYDMATGGLKKTFKNKEDIKRIVVTDDKMLLFNSNDKVYSINRLIQERQKVSVKQKINSELYLYNNQLYFINLDDNLVAVEIPK